MGKDGGGQRGLGGLGAHLGGLRGGVGTEETLEGDAGGVSGTGCGQGGGVSGAVQPGAAVERGGRRLTLGGLGRDAGHPLQRRLQGLACGGAGGGPRGGLGVDLRGGTGWWGMAAGGGHPVGASPGAAAPLTWKQMLATESRCLSKESAFCRSAWSRRSGLSWWVSRAPTCARSMEPSRIMDSAGGSERPRWLLAAPLLPPPPAPPAPHHPGWPHGRGECQRCPLPASHLPTPPAAGSSSWCSAGRAAGPGTCS